LPVKRKNISITGFTFLILILLGMCNISIAQDNISTSDTKSSKSESNKNKKTKSRIKTVNGVIYDGDVLESDLATANGYKWIADNFLHTRLGKIGKDNEDGSLLIEYYREGRNQQNWNSMITITISKTPFFLSDRNKVFEGQIFAFKKTMGILEQAQHEAKIYKLNIYENETLVDVNPTTKMALMHYKLSDERIIGFMMPYARSILTIQMHKKDGIESIKQLDKDVMLQTFKHMGKITATHDEAIYEAESKARKEDAIKMEEDIKETQNIKEEVESK